MKRNRHTAILPALVVAALLVMGGSLAQACPGGKKSQAANTKVPAAVAHEVSYAVNTAAAPAEKVAETMERWSDRQKEADVTGFWEPLTSLFGDVDRTLCEVRVAFYEVLRNMQACEAPTDLALATSDDMCIPRG